MTQKPGPCLKRPIVSRVESRVWDLRFRGAGGVCVSEAGPARGGLGTAHLSQVQAGRSQDLSAGGFPPVLWAEVKPGLSLAGGLVGEERSKD